MGTEWSVSKGRKVRAEAPGLNPSTEPGDMLKPGIYILTFGGRVVHIGRSKCMLTTIANHRTINGGADKLPDWFPIKHVVFDDFTIHPMPYKEAGALVEALIDFHTPRHMAFQKPMFPHTSEPPVITRRI